MNDTLYTSDELKKILHAQFERDASDIVASLQHNQLYAHVNFI